MPELPEVETVRLGLATALTGASFRRVTQNRPDLRFPFPEDFADRLVGRRIEAVGRRAKYLVLDLDDGTVLAAHLGMTGSFRIEAHGAETTPGLYHNSRGAAGPHDHVRFEFDSGASVTYNDPRRFGFMTLLRRSEFDQHALFRNIGIEPLSDGFTGAALARSLAGRNTSIKAALLDQQVVAGLGNIYVCEALHRAGISPRRMAGTLVRKNGSPSARAERLVATIKDVLLEALHAGGSTLRDYRQVDGALGTFQHGFRAYDREDGACTTPNCRGTIRRIVQSGRSTFFCAECQR